MAVITHYVWLAATQIAATEGSRSHGQTETWSASAGAGGRTSGYTESVNSANQTEKTWTNSGTRSTSLETRDSDGNFVSGSVENSSDSGSTLYTAYPGYTSVKYTDETNITDTLGSARIVNDTTPASTYSHSSTAYTTEETAYEQVVAGTTVENIVLTDLSFRDSWEDWPKSVTFGSTYTALGFEESGWEPTGVDTLTFFSGDSSNSITTESLWTSYAQTAAIKTTAHHPVILDSTYHKELSSGLYGGFPLQKGTRVYSPDGESFWVVGASGPVLTTGTTLQDSYEQAAISYFFTASTASAGALTTTRTVTHFSMSTEEVSSTWTTYNTYLFPPQSDTVSATLINHTSYTTTSEYSNSRVGFTVATTAGKLGDDSAGMIDGLAIHPTFSQIRSIYGAQTTTTYATVTILAKAIGTESDAVHIKSSTSGDSWSGVTYSQDFSYSENKAVPARGIIAASVAMIERSYPYFRFTTPTPAMSSGQAAGYLAAAMGSKTLAVQDYNSAAQGVHVLTPFPTRTWIGYDDTGGSYTATLNVSGLSFTASTASTTIVISGGATVRTTATWSAEGILATAAQPIATGHHHIDWYGNLNYGNEIAVLGARPGGSKTTVLIRDASLAVTTVDSTGGTASATYKQAFSSQTMELSASPGQVIIARTHPLPSASASSITTFLPDYKTTENFITAVPSYLLS